MTKKDYVKPTILKIENLTVGKAGVPAIRQKIRKEVAGVPVEELLEKYGSPLFVFSEKTIRDTYQKAYQAFSSRYPDVQFGWSYKTNYLNAICSVFHSEGAIAEVVSEYEYQKARELNIPGSDIIYNGPFKPYEALKQAAEDGAKIHIDHFDEISDLEKISDELGKIIPVAIRLNMDTGIYPQWSRFGFNIESGQAMDAVRRIEAGRKLKLTGLHSHIGTFMLSAAPYKVQTTKMVDLMKRIESETSFSIEYIDIGGGFASKSHLKGVYQPPEVVVPTIDDYAEAVTSALYENLEPGKYPRLYLETGRHMIDESGYLLSTIQASKLMPDGRRSYILDAGVHLLYTAFWYNYVIESAQEREGVVEPAILNGPLCMNIDVVDASILLPRMKRGDNLIISPVGAYNVTQWMQFIRYRPAIAMVSADGQTELIRRAENLDDVQRAENIPEWLSKGSK